MAELRINDAESREERPRQLQPPRSSGRRLVKLLLPLLLLVAGAWLLATLAAALAGSSLVQDVRSLVLAAALVISVIVQALLLRAGLRPGTEPSPAGRRPLSPPSELSWTVLPTLLLAILLLLSLYTAKH